MEPSRPGAMASVVDALNREADIAVGVQLRSYVSRSLVGDGVNDEAVARDLASSDLILVSHILLDDEAERLDSLLAHHAPADATLVVVSSAPALMRRTRIGRFRFGKHDAKNDDRIEEKENNRKENNREENNRARSSGKDAVGALAHLRRIVGRITRGRDISPYLKELMIVAPKLLRLIPGKMQDVRSYLEAYLYMVEPSPQNIRSMFLMLADRYAPDLRGRLAGIYAPPVVYPSDGLYHPDAPSPIASLAEYHTWYRRHRTAATSTTSHTKPQTAPRATVGIIVLRGDILMEETGQINATIRAFESRGIEVVAAYSSSFDYRAAIRMMSNPDGSPAFDALVSLTAFPLVGGHVRSDAAAAIEALQGCNVPYFAPVPLAFQTIEEWSSSRYGLSPLQTALHVALPELEGAIEPLVTGGSSQSGSLHSSASQSGSSSNDASHNDPPERTTAASNGTGKVAITERTERLVARVERWIALRHAQNSTKRVAITIFCFPPGKGAVGTAAYLDVFRSLLHTLRRLRDDGYHVELPNSPEEMIEQIVVGTEKLLPEAMAELNVAARISVAEYETIAGEASTRAREVWGPPPGNLNSDGRNLLVYGRRYGNVFVGVQPSFGYEGDPMRLLFAHGATPHHGFIAYYRWLDKVFDADCHLHFGTHGALEFMPGKQVGLDSRSWPDLLIGDRPNLYFYSINNPSEGTIAKRRALATLIGYLTPPLENAGLYRELGTLKGMILSWYESPSEDPRRRRIFEALVEKTDELNLWMEVASRSSKSGDEKLSSEILKESGEIAEVEAALFVGKLSAALMEIETRLIPTGLHVVGEAPSAEECTDLLLAVGEYERPELSVHSLTDLIAASCGHNYADLHRRAELGEQDALETFTVIRGVATETIAAMLRSDRDNSGDNESACDDAVDAGIGALREYLSGKRSSTKDLRTALGWLWSVGRHARELHELESLSSGLRGEYITPSIGADPVRNPEALPSGRNIHSLDPSAIPSAVAVRNARETVRLILAKHFEETGGYPRSIGMILWGLDNIKTQGEAIAQAMILAGVEPEANALGRITKLRVIPLSELGRARIDVTVSASGIFRDIFGLQLELLDEAFRMVAALDEPIEMNHLRARSLEIAESLDIPFSDASARVFSNSEGSYGTNIDFTVGMSAWNERSDLADLYLRRKSFIYGKGGIAGVEGRRLMEELASGIDTTLQNLDSSEVGITDVDHYFEYLGGLTNVVEGRRGIRPTVLVADTTTARSKVRTVESTIRLEARTKILNPKWYEGMMKHGYQGVEEIRKRLDYTFGFSATIGAVDSWIYDAVDDIYIADQEMGKRMQSLNIHAYTGLVRRLTEAHDRGLWMGTQERIERLRSLQEDLEDALEGVA